MNVMLTKKGANNTLVKRIGGLALGLLVIFLLSIKGIAIYNVALYLLLISLCIYSWKMRQLPKLPSGNIFFAYEGSKHHIGEIFITFFNLLVNFLLLLTNSSIIL